MTETLRIIPSAPVDVTDVSALGVPRRPSACGMHAIPLAMRQASRGRAYADDETADAMINEPATMPAPHVSSLEARQQELAQRLEDVRARNVRLGAEEKRLEVEIASVKEGLDTNRRRLPMAKMLIASPCDVPWETMAGDDRKRFCNSCQKNVHNLSSMTHREVEEFLDAYSNGDACVRLYERTDGTVLTADCPVGVRRRRVRSLTLSMLGAGACALFGFTAIAGVMSVAFAEPPKPQPVQRVIVQVPGPKVFIPQSVPVMTIPAGYTQLPTAPAGSGWVLVHARDNARIFDGKRALGSGSQVVTLPRGKHTLRAEITVDGKKTIETRDVDVEEHAQASVTFTTGTLSVRTLPSMAGTIRRAPVHDPGDTM